MKKVIRLTESDLTRIVKRVIKEDQQMKKQAFDQKALSCFNPKKYPQVYSLMKAYGCSVVVAAGILLTILSEGIASGIGITGAIFAGGEAYDAFESAINNPKSSFKKEAKDFLTCVGVL